MVAKGLSANVMPPKACVSLRLKNLTMKTCVRNGPEAVARSCSIKRCCQKFRKILRKKTCARVSEPEAWNFIKKETLAQLFSCEFCEISRNTFFAKHFRVKTPLLVSTL